MLYGAHMYEAVLGSPAALATAVESNQVEVLGSKMQVNIV